MHRFTAADTTDEFGAWQSIWERHKHWSLDGTYEAMFPRRARDQLR